MALQITRLLSFLAATAYASQIVFTGPADIGTSQHFTPAGTLDILSETSFTALAHPEFPRYGVRVKKTNFCDETVGAYTGYIDIEARHLFFYFFESRSEPAKDDVILGLLTAVCFVFCGCYLVIERYVGPGGSSSIGLLMELGPCKVIKAENGTVFHPESWNSKANVFFIDQPIGVGFSYADHGETVSTTEEAAEDIAAFVAIFFAHFSRFQGRGFHMAGESYGGRYIPLFAAAVYDQNPRLVEAGLPPINLTSIIIANGMTDFFSMVPALVEMQCSPASMPPTPPVQDIETCVKMKTILPRCQNWMKASCQDQFDLINCAAAISFCKEQIDVPYVLTGRNPYDVTKYCTAGGSGLCYEEINEVIAYLNKKDVQELLGVRPARKYLVYSPTVNFAFGSTMDIARGTTDYVAALLERNVRVLIYAGSYDWVCNWVGTERWTLALEWSGQVAFRAEPLQEWTVDGKRAGKTRSAEGFTFATVDAAGHMVPYDKPKESLEMINRWLAGQPL
ncbi:Alpha/Beta hydrolase protein [Mycena rebaudengoi]|nr:Alpha/Beta hydrolase protein [Mycena rebaudengoi]